MHPIVHFFNRNEIRISRIATIIVFLALIRSIIEPLRQTMTAVQLQSLIVGCLIAALGCLTATMLGFYGKYKATTVSVVLTIIVLIIFKSVYMQ